MKTLFFSFLIATLCNVAMVVTTANKWQAVLFTVFGICTICGMWQNRPTVTIIKR